ncbi:hypothetical protein C8A03DRAFT_38147 [Achaetomium macrosporum]|uniref:Uncharacterized protein n=1 Tax=Achaetomium macrosporum TaxID=79813 RepID=A0AAN7C2D0_9PEZI|nr:hypothetical protein C8A03DRAFT_38147 [Achaetomium macrosporum]
MAETETEPNPSIPEQLFHTVLTVIDYHADTSGSTQDVYVLGTHTTLRAAKAFALSALQQLGYQRDDFATYATRADLPPDQNQEWPHGDGVMVYAKAPKGQEFLVSLDTKPNTESLPASSAGDDTLLLPERCDHLHYVLQTKTDYNQDKSGAFQETEIQGCYVSRAAALAAAKRVLVSEENGISREDYAQYDERDGEEGEEEEEEAGWPFGEDVYVHAVAQTGENYTVAVKTPPGARRKLGKCRGEGV